MKYLELEEARKEFQRQTEKDREALQMKLEDTRKRSDRATRWLMGVAVAVALFVGVMQVVSSLIAAPSDSRVSRFFFGDSKPPTPTAQPVSPINE